MENLINISQAGQMLGYLDRRTISEWCNNHHLPVFKIGKKYFLLKEEFEEAFYKPINTHLNKKNNNSLQPVFKQTFIKGNNDSHSIDKAYTPVGENEKRFLGVLNSLAKK